MNLNKLLEATLKELSESVAEIKSQQLISLIDLTNLNVTATKDEIHALGIKAHKHHVAAVCIYPENLDDIPPDLALTRATVVNFPSGHDDIKSLIHAIDQIYQKHIIHEIDYVFPYQSYLSGDEQPALNHCRTIYKECVERNLIFKIILETGAFPSIEKIYALSHQLINIGCDFLKTSTGKIPQGATIPAAFAMLSAIKESQSACGIKISGGLKTKKQVTQYVQLAESLLQRSADKSWVRLGASGMLDTLISE